MKILRTAFLCLGISVLVEVSQLYQADWINGIRRTLVGALVLGNSFVWSDLLCYMSGCFLAGLFDFIIMRNLFRE